MPQLDPKVETCQGILAFFLTFNYWLFDHAYPVVITIGSLCGAFLAFHGVWVLGKNWYREYKFRKGL